MSHSRNYWGYRVDKNNLQFFWEELLEGRLRQGWGYDPRQNLKDFKLDEGAGRNMAMLKKVKKGDILLVPRIPQWDKVAIVEATEDWDKGYQYSIPEDFGDYGHIFPARHLKSFTRYSEHVSGDIRATLKNPSRFWNISQYANDIEKLCRQESDLTADIEHKTRLNNDIRTIFKKTFDDKAFKEDLYTKITQSFSNEDWEYALVHGLSMMFPFYQVERVGGTSEQYHGTDILIKMPSLFENYQYAIAIQVKDYEGSVSTDVISQINKAEAYFESENIKLVEKVVLITKADKDANSKLVSHDESVKFIFAHELKDILYTIGMNYLGLTNHEV